MTFEKGQTVREISIKHPAAVRVFETFGIDYCCGGNRPLAEACERANVALEIVINALEAEPEEREGPVEEQWTEAPLADLTAHIVNRHHCYVRDESPRLEWHWRTLLPLSALLELSGFLLFFLTVSGRRLSLHRPRRTREPWMLMVMAATLGFLTFLLLNAIIGVAIAWNGSEPALPRVLDQRLVALETWCFLTAAIWGFNARWLPVFLGLKAPNGTLLLTALGLLWAAILAGFAGATRFSASLLPAAAVTALILLRVWRQPVQPPKIEGVHPSFPFFIRAAYAWLLMASGLWLLAAWADQSGGWDAARHALAVGYISTMVFAIGQRVLPAFSGARVFADVRFPGDSDDRMRSAGWLGNPGNEGYSQFAWNLLPLSAIIELIAVSLFATNLLMTFLRPPAHLNDPRRLGSRLPQ